MEVFDESGRLQYNPDFHFGHGKKFTESDLEYICKFLDHDGPKSIAMALGKTEMTIADKIYKLKKDGTFDYYKNLNKYW